jgi:hypothetical protein
MTKILVTYLSQTGNTKKIAEAIFASLDFLSILTASPTKSRAFCEISLKGRKSPFFQLMAPFQAATWPQKHWSTPLS